MRFYLVIFIRTFQVICRSSTLIICPPFNCNLIIWLIIYRWWLGSILYFALIIFSYNLFNSSHFCISFASSFITFERNTILSGMCCSSWKEQIELVKFVSYAKVIVLKCSQALWISFIETMTSKEPRMKPCGTPVVTGSMLEWIPSTMTNWVLFVM